MKFVPQGNLGEAGEKETSASFYDWKWYYSTPTILLWAIVLLALFVLKENHDIRAWLIFVPVFAVYVFWQLLSLMMLFSSPNRAYFDMIFSSFVLGFAVLCLVSRRLENKSGLLKFISAWTVMFVVAGIRLMSYGIPGVLSIGLMPSVIFVTTPLVAIALTVRSCRRRYSNKRFAAYLLLWTDVLVFCCFCVYSALIEFLMRGSSGDIFGYLVYIIFASIGTAIIGLLVYVFLVPFMVLWFRSDFWRGRFYRCFNLGDKVEPAEADLYSDNISKSPPGF